MKTLSDYPMLIARLLAADEAHRARVTRWRRFWRSPWTTLVFVAVVIALACVLAREVLQ